MQVEHKTEKGVILFVDVPDDATLFGVNIIGNCFCYSLDGIPQTLDLDGYNWQLIGLTSEVTEEQAKMMVNEYREMEYPDYGAPYEIIYYDSDTPLEAFKEIMQHKNLYEVNPYKQKPCEGCDDYEVFTEAQKRTSKRVVLFKPNEK